MKLSLKLLLGLLVVAVCTLPLVATAEGVSSSQMEKNKTFTMLDSGALGEKHQQFLSQFNWRCDATTICASGRQIWCWAEGPSCNSEYVAGYRVSCAAWGGSNGYQYAEDYCP